jgi:hypothetical protein
MKKIREDHHGTFKQVYNLETFDSASMWEAINARIDQLTALSTLATASLPTSGE